MVREVASKTSDLAGDGTTTATVWWLRSPVNAPIGCRRYEPDGSEARHRSGGGAVVADLVKKSKKVTLNEEIAQVGVMSANTEIGRYLVGPGRPAKTYDVTARLEHYSHRSRRRMGWILPVYGLVLSHARTHCGHAQTASTIANRSFR
jgi:hypothetical protein